MKTKTDDMAIWRGCSEEAKYFFKCEFGTKVALC